MEARDPRSGVSADDPVQVTRALKHVGWLRIVVPIVFFVLFGLLNRSENELSVLVSQGFVVILGIVAANVLVDFLRGLIVAIMVSKAREP